MKMFIKAVLIFSLLLLFLVACSSSRVCNACGETVSELVACPVCGIDVCESCADPDIFLDRLYNSWELADYLTERGYIVLDRQEALNLYGYGFASGYAKGASGVWDEETEEFVNSYEWLKERYGQYGY